MSPLDTHAIERRLGQINHETKLILGPLRERHAGAAAEIAEMQAHNRHVRAGTLPQDRATHRAERARAAGASEFLPSREETEPAAVTTGGEFGNQPEETDTADAADFL